MLKGKYGYFSEDQKAYIIDNWRTPKPWINVISNGHWGLTVSQAGSGYSWLEHAMLNRITRWNQDLVSDQSGKYLFIRDRDSNVTWSVTPQPLKPEFTEFSCLHGLGYTTFSTAMEGVKVEFTLFVPEKMNGEVWKVSVTNHSGKFRRLSLFSYAELLLDQFPDWHREFHKTFIKTRYDGNNHAIIAEKSLWTTPVNGDGSWNKSWPYSMFFFSDVKPDSFECDKERFIGQYNTLADADAYQKDVFSNTSGTGFDAVASLQFNLDLAPGSKKDFTMCLGVLENSTFTDEFPKIVKAVNAGSSKLLAEVKEYWENLCGRLKIKTPDPAMDCLVNYWLKYQAISCRMNGRSAYYQCGGAYGFRDQLQDSRIFLTLDPSRTANQIRMHAQHQKTDGTVHHWWHPVSGEGRFTDISDDLLWLPYVVSDYLKETSDFELLNEHAPYWDEGSGSILEHCLKAVDRALIRRSPRKLSLIGEGDWNDGMNGVGTAWKGESVWLTIFLYEVLGRLTAILQKIGYASEIISSYREEMTELKKSVLTHAMQGKWIYRATRDDGEVMGADSGESSRMFLNPQTWAVMSGLVSEEVGKKLMRQVEKNLYRDYGVLLFHPAYSEPDARIGYLTRYAPGVRENGGVYTHAAIWTIIAQAKARNGEKVHETFRRLCPVLLSNADADRYMGEPYVTPGNIEGPESRHEGRGAWTWYTGSAAWLYTAVVEYLLGVRYEFGELVVDPAIPSDWPGFSMERMIGDRRVLIEVNRVKNSGSDGFETKRTEI